jgi:hypothetical protein
LSLAFLHTAINIEDIAALKVLIAPDRQDGSIRIVKDPSGGLPPTLYRYSSSATGSELLPAYITPNDSVGRWVQLNQGTYYSNSAPVGAPPISGILWLANLANPARFAMWRSIGSVTVADWLPIPIIVELPSDPAFNADYIGQKVINTVSKVSWVAVDRLGTWILESNEIITIGANINQNYAIALSDAGLWKTITAPAIITLPAIITNKFSLTLIRELATGSVTIAADVGATLKAKGTNIAVDGGVVELFNLGTGVWYAKGDLS